MDENEVTAYSPFVQLDLEGTGIGEHIVVRSHPSQNRVNRAQPMMSQRSAGERLHFRSPGLLCWDQHTKLSHDLGMHDEHIR